MVNCETGLINPVHSLIYIVPRKVQDEQGSQASRGGKMASLVLRVEKYVPRRIGSGLRPHIFRPFKRRGLDEHRKSARAAVWPRFVLKK